MKTGQRVDAQENRQRIQAVAREAIGLNADVSMHAIAKLAGVGQATLYRNFPTREALILALYREGIEDLVAQTRQSLSQHSPASALRRWLYQLAAFGQARDGLSNALRAMSGQLLSDPGYQAMYAMMGELLQLAQAAGEIRADISNAELHMLTNFIWHFPIESGHGRCTQLIDIVLDGLRA